MKVSIITVVFNNVRTIENTIRSVLGQKYPDIEYIVVDGVSEDGTLEVIDRYRSVIDIVISEPDSGMYDAMNKGIRRASGDIIGIINADDFFANEYVIEKVALNFINEDDLDCVIGDVGFVRESKAEQIVRFYSSSAFKPSQFAWGLMPAHPSFYCRTKWFHIIGGYRLDFRIAADYELLIRFLLIRRLKFKYLNILMVKMSLGGISTNGIRSTFLLNREIMYACRINGIYTNYLMIYSKYFYKVFEIINFKRWF